MSGDVNVKIFKPGGEEVLPWLVSCVAEELTCEGFERVFIEYPDICPDLRVDQPCL